jgi:cytosine/adenosine deaminase-related metal-dependent hydrolase
MDRALDGGSAALGITSGLQVGMSADLLALREEETARHDRALDRWIFGNLRIEAVWRAGRQVVADGRHMAREPIERRFADIARRLVT